MCFHCSIIKDQKCERKLYVGIVWKTMKCWCRLFKGKVLGLNMWRNHGLFIVAERGSSFEDRRSRKPRRGADGRSVYSSENMIYSGLVNLLFLCCCVEAFQMKDPSEYYHSTISTGQKHSKCQLREERCGRYLWLTFKQLRHLQCKIAIVELRKLTESINFRRRKVAQINNILIKDTSMLAAQQLAIK